MLSFKAFFFAIVVQLTRYVYYAKACNALHYAALFMFIYSFSVSITSITSPLLTRYIYVVYRWCSWLEVSTPPAGVSVSVHNMACTDIKCWT